MAKQYRQSITVMAALIVGLATLSIAPIVHAATTYDSKLTQTISSGTLSTDVRDGSGNLVSTPSFAMGSVSVSTAQQTATGTFGTASQRITVDNPGGANSGWTLTLNSKTPATSEWTSGALKYKYNGTAAQGQLTINPTPGTLTATIGTTNNITKGSSAAFSGSTPITLLNAAAASDDILNVYLTGVGLSQTIPAGQASGSYELEMVQTVTAS